MSTFRAMMIAALAVVGGAPATLRAELPVAGQTVLEQQARLLTEVGAERVIVIAERLPFKRPYHTPLFEPYMGAFRELFAEVPFGPPHTPVYCCTTAARSRAPSS